MRQDVPRVTYPPVSRHLQEHKAVMSASGLSSSCLFTQHRGVQAGGALPHLYWLCDDRT